MCSLEALSQVCEATTLYTLWWVCLGSTLSAAHAILYWAKMYSVALMLYKNAQVLNIECCDFLLKCHKVMQTSYLGNCCLHSVDKPISIWQASIYMCKLFKFKLLFTWKSLRQDVFLICSSSKVIIWNKSLNLPFIGLKLEESNLQAITSKNKLF